MPFSPASAPTGAAAAAVDPSRAHARPRDTRAREGLQPASGEEGRRRLWLLALRAAWRWRRELSPLGLALSLLLVPAVGHAAAGGLAWTPLPAGLGAAAAAVTWGHRPIHRQMAYGAVVAGIWAAAAWWVGLADPVVLGGFLLLVVVTGAVWMRHVHPRARVRVVGGSVWPWSWERFRFQLEARREIQGAMARWQVASYWGRVPRSEIRAAVADIEDDHYLLTVELVPGHIALDLDNRRAASAIGAPVALVSVIQDVRDSERAANVVMVRWFHSLAIESGGEEEGDDVAAAARSEVVRPEPVDVVAERLQRVRAALPLSGQPISARRVASLAGLDRTVVRTELLPELQRRGDAAKDDDGMWRLTRAA